MLSRKNDQSKKIPVGTATDRKTGEITDNPKNIFKFTLDQLVMKNGNWEMHCKIYRSLEVINKNYRLTLTVGLDDINEKIKLCDGRRDKAQMDIDGSSAVEEEYKMLCDAKEELINNCPDIEILSQVKSSKYPLGETFIVFHILPDIINQLNDHRSYMKHYDLKMEPLIQ